MIGLLERVAHDPRDGEVMRLERDSDNASPNVLGSDGFWDPPDVLPAVSAPLKKAV